MTTNKPMTGEQLDELMTVAVNMQRDSEKVGERRVAMFAYAVQIAVLELLKVREIKPADEDHVAAMNSITAIIAILGSSDTLGISEQVAELKAQRDSLAAENAALIEQAEEVYAAGYNHGHLNTVDGIAYADCVKDDFYGLAAELMREAETPATNAFLAEVRAQESKRIYESILDNPAVTDMESIVDWLEQYANDSVAFAAQLRKGVQS